MITRAANHAIGRGARGRRAFAVALVLWATAVGAIAVVGMQASGGRAAAAGRQTLARIRAYWAARAGVEAVIARLQSESSQDQPASPADLLASLDDVAEGALAGSAYRVLRGTPAGAEPGVTDAHAKININTMSFDDLMLLPGMTEEIADAIIDWTTPLQTDEEAPTDDYAAMPIPYTARHGPIRALAELELVTNVRPEDVRGLDRNLDGIIDATELDAASASGRSASTSGSATDFGWSGYVTASSIEGVLMPDGTNKIDLTTAQAKDLLAISDISDTQAGIILAWVQSAETMGTTPTMEDYISTSPAQMAQRLLTAGVQIQGINNAAAANRVPALTNDQLKAVYDGCVVDIGAPLSAGRVNLNTAPDDLLDYVSSLTSTERDAIRLYREQNSGEVASVIDLLQIPQISRTRLATLAKLFTAQSTVFCVTSRGRDATSGLEVEIIAEVERSSWPLTVRSLIVR